MRSIFAKIIFWLFTLTAVAIFGLGLLTIQNSRPTTPALLVSWALILYWNGARLHRIVMRQPSVSPTAEFDMANELISWLLTVFAAFLFSIVLILIFSGKVWLSIALFFAALFPYWLANKDAYPIVIIRRCISRVFKRVIRTTAAAIWSYPARICICFDPGDLCNPVYIDRNDLDTCRR